MKVIVDAFGGDNAPREIIKGAKLAADELGYDIVLVGDEEKIRSGKKLVKTALFSYAFILGIDLILSAIESLI